LIIAFERDASKCIETFCYIILTIIGFHLSTKIVSRPNLQCSKVICVFAICALKNNCENALIAQTVLDYLPKGCNSAFVKVIFLKKM